LLDRLLGELRRPDPELVVAHSTWPRQRISEKCLGPLFATCPIA
jgi:hypothetical protein